MSTVRVTIDQAREEFKRLRETRVPRASQRVAYQLALTVKREVNVKLNVPKSWQAQQLRRYAAGQDIYQYKDKTFWGLPTGELQSRIGAFREVGGTIVPKRMKMLRIPLAAAKKPSGQDRYEGEHLRDHPGFFVSRRLGSAGHAGLVLLRREQRGKNAVVRAWYALVYSVKIGPHPWLQPSVDAAYAKAGQIVDQVLGEEVSK